MKKQTEEIKTNDVLMPTIDQAVEQDVRNLSLADQVKMEKQIRADKCIKELSEAIDVIVKKYDCRLVVQMLIGETGAQPQMSVVANDLK